MAQLRQDHERFDMTGTLVVVVGPESPDAFASYWLEHDLPFIGLPDPDHSVLKLYGQEIRLFKLGRMPAQVLVDKGGIARFAHYGHDMTDIPSNDEIFDLIKKLEAHNTHVQKEGKGIDRCLAHQDLAQPIKRPE